MAKIQLPMYLIALLVGGCALHPLPEDVAGLDTYAIATQIRCEAREAIMTEARNFLDYTHAPPEIMDPLRRDPNEIVNLYKDNKKSLLTKQQIGTLEKYRQASISIEFLLQMTEDNNIGGSAGILNTFLSGNDLITLNASSNHARRNFRNFRFTENWLDLVKDVRTCSNYRGSDPDYNYPIAGRVGLMEVVDSYFRINEQVNLTSPSKDKDDDAFVDDLTFTTVLSGSVGPAHTLNTLSGRSLILKSSSGSLLGDRTDQHELVVALFIPGKTSPTAAKGGTTKEKSLQKTNDALDRQTTKRFLFGINPSSSLTDLLRNGP